MPLIPSRPSNQKREYTRFRCSRAPVPVSYTHLDVYKRQAYRWGNTGDFERHTVTRGNFDGVTVMFPEEEHLNTKTVYVQVTFTGSYTVSGALNDTMLVEGSSQSGNYRVDMEEGDNRLSFYVTDSLGNIRTFGKDVHVDVTAPQLSVLRDLNGQSTSETVSYTHLDVYKRQNRCCTIWRITR